MSEIDNSEATNGTANDPHNRNARCPECDSVVHFGDARCLMCGTTVEARWFQVSATDHVEPIDEAAAESTVSAENEPALAPQPSSMAAVSPPEASVSVTPARTPPVEPAKPLANYTPEEAVPAEPGMRLFPSYNRSGPIVALVVVFVLFTACIGGFVFVNPQSLPIALVNTHTPAPSATATPTETTTPSPTATPSATSPSPTLPPTITPTAAPTETPQPPRSHTVATGETLFGIAFLYGITLDSVLTLNEFSNETLVREGQDILVPWPTATPPLQPLAVQVGEETIIVDPANCPPFYEIQEGDSIFLLASQNNVPLDALLALNYLTADSIVQPGDPICIPEVIIGGFLPPTPGPSPTPSPTIAPAGPRLLYPAPEFTFEPGSAAALQWLAVKELAPNEWYMVEVIDLTDVDAHPYRGFTRYTSLQLPESWRPTSDHAHQFNWQVNIVQVTGRRADGSFIYTYGGRSSAERMFNWR